MLTLTLEPNRDDPERYARLVRYELEGTRDETGGWAELCAVPLGVRWNHRGLRVRTVRLGFDQLRRDRAPRDPDREEHWRLARLEAAWRSAGAPPLTMCTPDHSVRAAVYLRDHPDVEPLSEVCQ